MALLSRDNILGASDLPVERVEVPEWGGHVNVRTLTGAERDQFEAEMFAARGGGQAANLANVRARLCVRAVVDDHGARLFGDEDAALLGRKSGRALDRVFEAAQRLSGFRSEDVEELAKNSAGGPSAASTSSSPSPSA